MSPSYGNGFANFTRAGFPYHPSDSWGLEGPFNYCQAVGFTFFLHAAQSFAYKHGP